MASATVNGGASAKQQPEPALYTKHFDEKYTHGMKFALVAATLLLVRSISARSLKSDV